MIERSSWTGSAADLLGISVERAGQVGDNIGKNPRALAGHLRRAQIPGCSASRLHSVVKAEEANRAVC